MEAQVRMVFVMFVGLKEIDNHENLSTTVGVILKRHFSVCEDEAETI